MPKPESTTKDARLEIRLTTEEKDRLAAAADADGRSLSNWIRFVLLQAANKRPAKRQR